MSELKPKAPPTFTLTPEQEAIREAVRTQHNSLMVTAYAGCAKSTTLELIANEVPKTVPGLALAFNVKIKKELEARFPSTIAVKTLNGLGHAVWCKTINKRCEVDDKKQGKLLTAYCKDQEIHLTGDDWETARGMISMAMSIGLVPRPFDQSFPGLVEDSTEAWKDIAFEKMGTWSPRLEEVAREVLCLSIKQSYQGLISFDDQIYMSCQPAGTIVLAKSGARIVKKPIEAIKAGDELVVFDRKRGKITGLAHHGSRVSAVGQRNYSGILYTIYADGEKTASTSDHKWLVRFNPNLQSRDLWFTYLMYRDGSYRIGQTQTKSTWPGGEKSFGFSKRCNEEKAEKGWILGVHFSLLDSKKEEALLVAQFGITDTCFESELGSSVHNEQKTWKDLPRRAEKLLKYFLRDEAHPFWLPQSTRSFNSNFVTESCNLISDIMQVPVFIGTENPKWTQFVLQKDYAEDLLVYSLDVNRHHTYIADNIVTHNCLFKANFPRYPIVMVDEAQDLSALNHIQLAKSAADRLIVVGDPKQAIYGFRGAHGESMGQIRALRNSWIELPLSMTFRVPRVMVKRQLDHAPGFRAAPTNKEGAFSHWTCAKSEANGQDRDEVSGTAPQTAPRAHWTWSEWDALRPHPAASMAILCRNNAPLLAMAFKLIRQGIAATMLGRDIGKGLVVLSRKLLPDDDTSAEQCSRIIEEWQSHQTAIARANDHEEKVAAINDRAECLKAVLEFAQARSAGALRQALTDLFGRDTGRVILSTIHRAKGLEWDMVLHLDPFRIPSKFARQMAAQGSPKQLKQELNLRYVAETRTKDVFVQANLEDFQ